MTSGRAIRARKAASASDPNSPAVIGRLSARFAPWPRTSMTRQWIAGGAEELGHRQEPVASRFPAVDQRHAGPGGAVPGGDEPAGQGQLAGRDVDGLERQAELGGRDLRRPRRREARPDPVEDARSGRPARAARRRWRRPGPRGEESARRNGTARDGRCQARRAVSRGPVDPIGSRASAPISSGRGEARSARRPRHRARGDPHPGQGGLAAARPAAPSGPDRRRPGSIARRDAADGRDQRGLRGADAGRRRGPAALGGSATRTRTAPARERPAARTARAPAVAARLGRVRPAR